MSGKKAKQARKDRLQLLTDGNNEVYWDYVDEYTANIANEKLYRAQRWTIHQRNLAAGYNAQGSLAAIAAVLGMAAPYLPAMRAIQSAQPTKQPWKKHR